MRFDRHTVAWLESRVMTNHDRSARFGEYRKRDFSIGQSLGRGSRYIDVAGRYTVLGGGGARQVVAYLYGMGAAVGSWDALHGCDKDTWDKVFALVSQAQKDLGQDEFEGWAELGRVFVDEFAESVLTDRMGWLIGSY